MNHAPEYAQIDACLKDGRTDDAIALCTALIDAGTTDARVWIWRGTLWRDQGRTADAIVDYQKALDLSERADVHSDLADLLRQSGQGDAAVAHYRAALALDPNIVEAHNGLGILAKKALRFDEAVAHYQDAVACDPNFAPAHNNLGIALQDLAQYDAAMTHFDRAIELQPEYAKAHFHRALLKMLLGQWRDGFEEYQWRWRMPGFTSPYLAEPWWSGEKLKGKMALLHGEQGMGDVIQFIRYAPLLKHAGAKVVAEVPAKIKRLLTGVPGVDVLIAKGEEPPPFDVQLPMMSMPLVRHFTPHRLPRFDPYIKADPELVAMWRGRLGVRTKLRIGISWQGNPNYQADYYRSPPLAAFAPLLAIDGVEFYSLQKGHGTEQLDQLPGDLRAKITDLSPDLDTGPDAFVDTAAVMECLDLMIMSDTGIMHVAGALGRPVWVPLSYVPDWRFQTDTDTQCIWYPTIRLYRQQALADWTGAFDAIARDLRVLMGHEPW